MNRQHLLVVTKNLILIALLPSLLMSCGSKDFFDDMPTKYSVDSLTVLKDLVAGLQLKHLDDNIIEVRSTEADLVPFAGVLEVKNDTIFYRQAEEKPAMPYLKLNAPRFDTLHINYSDRRADQVIAMGRVYDVLSRDSLYHFQLKPLKRISSNQSIYLKSIALRKGEGIKYLTFGKDDYSVTIALIKFPKVVAAPNW
ncbi:hypothetical protein WBG78_08200 [Chryseolinea sp. T2]|uniref:hypothetical protein n=1 Tax=Chryseolinea sp. T2 TaxID=3129255 RepID=UPI0030776993